MAAGESSAYQRECVQATVECTRVEPNEAPPPHSLKSSEKNEFFG